MKLTEEQLALLTEIEEMDWSTIATIASSIGRTRSATRSAVKRLKKRGLVQHSEITYAGRDGLRWAVTDAGVEALASARETL